MVALAIVVLALSGGAARNSDAAMIHLASNEKCGVCQFYAWNTHDLIDTDSGAFCSGSPSLWTQVPGVTPDQTRLVSQSGGPDIRVFDFTDFNLPAGSGAILLETPGDLTIGNSGGVSMDGWSGVPSYGYDEG